MLHTIEGYRWFIANVILNECEVTVAEDESGMSLFSHARDRRSGSYIPALIASAWVQDRS
jgi:hypothetical protein